MYNFLMWWRAYKDYPPDSPLKKERVDIGKGLVGCEMHEQMGWGKTFPLKRKQSAGRFFILDLFRNFFV